MGSLFVPTWLASAIEDKIALDSQILTEQFYFYTVVVMWLIPLGFLAAEPDAAWGWSSGGWLTTRFGFHDAIASLVVHGVAGAFTLGVLLNLGPRIGKYDMKGRARTFRAHNTPMPLSRLMLP